MRAKVLKSFDALPGALRNHQHPTPTHVTARHQPHADAAVGPALFANEVGPVTPLANPICAEPVHPKPKPRPRPGKAQLCTESRPASPLQTTAAPSRWADHNTVSWHRFGVDRNLITQLERGQQVVEAKIDLHGRTRNEARLDLTRFVRSAVSSGRRCVLVVHGKGHGSPDGQSVLRANVPCWLKKLGDVMAFTQARECQGGAGALIVLLRRETSRSPSHHNHRANQAMRIP